MTRRFANHGGSTFRFATSLVFVCLAAALGIAGCGSDDDNAGVIVERAHVFRVELPPGWRVILPEPNVHEDRVPVFSAFPEAGTKEAGVVLFLERGPSLEAKAQELAELPTLKLGAFKRESDASREMMITTGIDDFSGQGLDTVLAVLRSPERPEEMWIFYCLAPELSKSPCEEIVRGFTLLPSLRIP